MGKAVRNILINLDFRQSHNFRMIEQMESQLMAMHGVQIDFNDKEASNNIVTQGFCELGSK